ITIIATGLESQPTAKAAQMAQQSVKPLMNTTYKPQTNLQRSTASMGELSSPYAQSAKPINFDTPARPKPGIKEIGIEIPGFLQKNRK
ncbi:MAG: hypothetical protein J6J86_10510, partial [Lachnospiraceae bacterium]|nr:hypothetical protein [Lachnospiraceae bacterium]